MGEVKKKNEQTIKNRFVFVLMAGLLLLLLWGCKADQGADDQVYTSLEELENKRIGVTTGSVQALQVEERFPNAELYYFFDRCGLYCCTEDRQDRCLCHFGCIFEIHGGGKSRSNLY